MDEDQKENKKIYYFIAQWGKAIKAFILFGLVFFIFITGYFFLQAKLAEKKLLSLQINDLRIQLEKKQKEISEYRTYKKNIDLLKQAFFLYPDESKLIFKSGGQHKAISRDKLTQGGKLMAFLSGKSLTEPLTPYFLKRVASKKQAAFTESSVEILVGGNKKNIIKFLYQLSTLPSPALLKTFKYSLLFSRNRILDNEGKLHLFFDIYHEPEDTIFFTSLSTTQARDNVFDYKKLSPDDENPLTHYSLVQLKMCGVLSADSTEEKWGLISLPDGKVYKVELGDELGLEHARVITINTKKIVVRESANGKISELIIRKKDF